jgi:predicted ArsR family transcriptional regulator
MHQHTLFPAPEASHVNPHALARTSDPATSHEAAASVKSFAGEHHAALLRVLAPDVPLGAEQLARMAGMDAYQARKRLPELERAGLAKVADGTRKTASGRSERLWLLVSQ